MSQMSFVSLLLGKAGHRKLTLDVNAVTVNGRTPLPRAATGGSAERCLLAAGARPDAVFSYTEL